MNTQCNSNSSTFQLPDKVGSRKVVADFSGGTLTSNAGALLYAGSWPLPGTVIDRWLI